jgi:pimeloyl-ACP methyl ester carboxylesterase
MSEDHGTSTSTGTNTIPLHLLFAKPSKDQVRLSPKGTYLAYRSRDVATGVLNLWLQEVATGKERQLTFERERDVCIMYWFTYDDQSIVYLREPQRGRELYHLYSIDFDFDFDFAHGSSNNKPRDLIDSDNTTCAMGFAGGLQVWLDPQQPRHVYTATAPCGFRSLFWNISKIHIDTGEQHVVAVNALSSSWWGLVSFVLQSLLLQALLRLLGLGSLEQQPRATVQWFPDQHMNFRGRLEVSLMDLSCAWRVKCQNDNKEEWKQLHHVTWANANMSLVGSTGGSGTAHFDFSSDGKTVDLHVCNRANTTSYERYDMERGQHVKQLASHAQSDIIGFQRHAQTRAVQAVKYNYEKPTLQCLPDCPDDVQHDLAFLRQEFREASVSIVSRTLDDLTWVVHVQSDVGLQACLGSPSGYFALYRHFHRERKQSDLKFLLSPQPELNKFSLGTMEAVHIPTRDGQDLLCYLSRPPSPIQSANTSTRALVLLVHGGPQARDIWQFHPLCQLLCNRGMSVLQVNFRGSTGLGTRFMKLGMGGEFAKGVQDDIEDAALHAVKKGWCTSESLAIMGGSFGGYCALSALTYRAPSKAFQYQCAVAICPCSIMGAANPHKGFYGNPLIARYWRQVYGADIADNMEASKQVSPVFHVDKLSCPLLLLHGEDDPRVPIEQTNDLFRKIEATPAGSNCEYIRFAKEGHGIQKEQNVLYMYHSVERFLCQHLKLPDPPALKESWVRGHTGVQVSPASMKDKKV